MPLVLVVNGDASECARIETVLRGAGFGVKTATTAKGALDEFYAEPPRAVLVKHGITVEGGRLLVDEIKADNVYGHLPVILLLAREQLQQGIDWARLPADEYVVEPFADAELVARVRICLARAQRDINANPLTGLPGNLTVTREAERRLAGNEEFAFAYLDLDGFKAFNDRYGFSRGDEVLRMTARVVVNAVRSLGSESTYVGHIGGDDYVFITPSDLIAQACERVIRDFDLVIGDFYDEEDQRRGAIQSHDRQGNLQTFPITSCSIGVVDTRATRVSHIAELFERVSEVKTFTKRLPGSNYIIDRRK